MRNQCLGSDKELQMDLYWRRRWLPILTLGFIRKYDTIASVNGGANLTGAQKHGLVDTIQKGGALISAWENEDGPGPTPEDPPKISPVYSMDVHSEAVWLVTGNQTGNINLWTVRHEEGKVTAINLAAACSERTQKCGFCTSNCTRRKITG